MSTETNYNVTNLLPVVVGVSNQVIVLRQGTRFLSKLVA